MYVYKNRVTNDFHLRSTEGKNKFEIDDLLDIDSYPIDRQMAKLWDGNFCFFELEFLNL